MTSTATTTRAAEVQQAHADAALIAATPTTTLLRTAYSLTHQLHTAQSLADTRGYPDRAAARELVSELRAKRDLIDAEVLRRTGGA